MDTFSKQPDAGLRHWNPDITCHDPVQACGIIKLVEADTLDLMRSRAVEQEVLNLLDGTSF